MESAVIPLDLQEPLSTVTDMVEFLKELGVVAVRLVHVADSVSSSRAASQLDEVARHITQQQLTHQGAEPKMPVTTHVFSGSTVAEILECANAWDAGLVAIPWKRRSWLQRNLAGSVTRDILKLNGRPTLIFRKRDRIQTGPLRVAYATDLGPSDDAVVPLLAGRHLSMESLELIHADERAPDLEAEKIRQRSVAGRLETIADQIAAGSDRPGLPHISMEQRVGQPRKEILKHLAYLKPDLVILAKSGKPRGFAAFLGSVAEQTAYRASASVLVVPPKE
ncbi:MAG: universal stress protein [Alkalispirochaeta sp.]|jgi:nucleotide-binding universal stress UspA family protein